MSEVKKQTNSNVNIKIKNILYVIFSILFVTSICLNVFQYFKGQDSSGIIGVSSVCKIDDINKCLKLNKMMPDLLPLTIM